jgi:hypothetical protein
MRAGGGKQRVVARRETEETLAGFALKGDRVSERLAPAGADLDLGPDQLAGHRLGEDRVRLGRIAQFLEALVEREGLRVEDRELLLDPYREVR